jgi:hypothetical protein
MIWPWTSVRKLDALQVKLDLLTAQQAYMVDREAFNLVIDERDRLRGQVDELMDHAKRIDRVEHGMTEEERKKRESLGKFPFELDLAFKGYRPEIRKLQTEWAWNQRKSGRSWEEIVEEVQTNQKARE